MAEIARSQGCCGVRELYNLGGDSVDIVHQVRQAITGSLNAAYYWFADREGAGNGDKLARYIKKHELGTLTKMGPTFNPQSRHNLNVWMWEINKEAIIKLSDARQ